MVCPPGAQLYVVAPDAERVTLFPVHIVADGFAVIIGDGGILTVTVLVAAFVQPMAFVPVTVYVTVAVGLSVMLAVVCPEDQM